MSNLAHLQVESSFITLLHVNQLIFPSCAKEQLMNATLEGYDHQQPRMSYQLI